MMPTVNTALYGNLKGAKRVNLKVPIIRKKFFLSFCLVSEAMDANKTYCGYHFTIYISQGMLYTLNLYTVLYIHTCVYSGVNYISIKLKRKRCEITFVLSCYFGDNLLHSNR